MAALASAPELTQLSNDNVATVTQNMAKNVKALVKQEGGTQNQGTVLQSGEFNEATILQNGSAQVATITQSGIGTAALPNVAIIDQGGIGHHATVAQSGGAGNYAKVVQR